MHWPTGQCQKHHRLKKMGAGVPRDEYEDDFEDVEEVDEFEDDFEEVEEFDDDVEEAEILDEAADAEERGRRQIQRGAASRLSDRLTGGASRPGEEEVRRSPFVIAMLVTVACLALAAIVFGILIINEGEKRAYRSAETKLKEDNFGEAEKKFKAFLIAYPEGEYAEQAKIGLHTARVRQYTKSVSMTPKDVTSGVEALEDFIKECRNLDGFETQGDNVKRWASRMSEVAAMVAAAKFNETSLEDSRVAEAILEKQWRPDSVPVSVTSKLMDLQRKAESAIVKNNSLTRYLEEIQGYLAKKETFAALGTRQALLDAYPVLDGDAEIQSVLNQILDVEKSLVVTEAVGTAGMTGELPTATKSGLSLALRTQKSVDQVSQGRVAFTMGIDSCFGVDTETGEPLWKRKVGVNPVFAPVPVDGATKGVLLYHTGLDQLMLLAENDGSLLWRQQLDSPPSCPPLISEQQIYLTTSAGQILKISVDSGRINSKVTFNQKVVGPPTLSRDKKFMLIPGDQSIVYSLDAVSLKSSAVSYIEHRPGSIEAPLQTMGYILLLCDNDAAEESRVRILEVSESDGAVSTRYQTTIAGQIRDQCILRGTNLFIPSTPQRVTAFTVNDSPDADPPIARIGGNQLEELTNAPIHLTVGPNNSLWMASQSFRKFQVRSNAVELLQEEMDNGLHVQPPQFADRAAYSTTVAPYSSSVFFTRVDPSAMKGEWRTVVGTNVVAAGPAKSGSQMLLVGDFGSVFRVPLNAIGSQSFFLDQISTFQIPDKLDSPVGGITLQDGRVAAWCGGEQPATWTFTETGQLESRWDLPAEPVLPPVTLADGVAFAMQGRIHMTAVRGTKVEDYRAAQGIGSNTTWKSLTAIGDRQLLAISSDNQAVQLEYRSSTRPSLVEISRGGLPASIDLKPTAAGELIMAVSAEGELLAMSAADTQLLKKVDLGGLPSQPVHVAGDLVFTDVRRSVMKVFRRSPDLEMVAEYPLTGGQLVGSPVPVRDGYVACFSNGAVIRLDSNGRPTDKRLDLGQAASQGPILVGQSLVVISVDGSLYLVDELIGQ
ncbi:MAG: PQQ-binding-like beta-propeller repeat protein [Fuerstiella sp.]